MLISRETVENDVQLILQTYNYNRKIKEKVIKKFEEKGFLRGEINSIFTGTNPLMQVSDELFWLLITILYNNIDDEVFKAYINPDKILTDIEKEAVKNIKIDRKQESMYPIVIENVYRDAEGNFSTLLYLDTLVNLFDRRIIKYNSDTQRPLVSKYYRNHETKEIYLNPRNKKEIEQNIINGFQIEDHIVFNVLQNGEEEFEYNPETKKLIIYSGDFFIIDGWHRVVAGVMAYKKKPNTKFYYKTDIQNWDVDKAKAFVRQKSLGTQIDLLSQKSYDVYNTANQVVKKLNETPKSLLRGKITTDEIEIKKGNALVSFNLLFDCIDYMFDVNDNKEVFKVSNYIKEGIEVIATINPKIMDTPLDEVLWVAYINILAKYYNVEDWQSKVIDTIENINYGKINELEFRTINKAFINKLNNYISTINV